MDYYSAQVIVRLEHKERMRSAGWMRAHGGSAASQPLWIWRQLRRLLNVSGNGLIAVGKRLTLPQDITGSIQHTDPQGQHAS